MEAWVLEHLHVAYALIVALQYAVLAAVAWLVIRVDRDESE